MGWDIISVGQHNLNTSSIKNLAKDLSERLDVNIIYGSFEVATYCKKTHTLIVDFKRGFVEFGRFIRNDDSDRIYHLVDDSHSHKEILNGVKNLQTLNIDIKGDYYSGKTAILKEILDNFHRDYVKCELYATDTNILNLYEIFSVDILKDTVLVDIKEPFRWFGFLDIFKKEIEEHRKKYFFEYRKQLKRLYTSLGANQIVFFADQGIGEWILDKVWEYNWNDLKEYIQSKTYYTNNQIYKEFTQKEIKEAILLNVSDFFLNNCPLHSDYEDTIDVLFDDFKDLEN